MVEHYYEREDYQRALDIENALDNHPDAKFLDVILFNYGRCLYRIDRKSYARRRFDQRLGTSSKAHASDAADFGYFTNKRILTQIGVRQRIHGKIPISPAHQLTKTDKP